MSLVKRINELFSDYSIRKKLLKLRIPIAVVLFVFLLPFLEADFFLPGLIVSIFGEAIQLWCFATIHTKKVLTTTGPYMFVRNPMYLGRFFIILGILMMTGNAFILLFYAVIYYFYMLNRVQREETQLEDLFGADYRDYMRDVHRYLPTLNKRFSPELMMTFNPATFTRNSGWVNAVVMCVAYLLLGIAAYAG